MRDVFAAIEGQLEMLRSNLLALTTMSGPESLTEGLWSALGQLEKVIERLRRYREG